MKVFEFNRWRTIDIVVASVIAVAFGVIFWAWGTVWSITESAFAFFPPAQALIYGVWLVPAVLAGLIIRKPGAALYAEAVAATVSALLGSQWGVQTVVQGLVQGLGAELVFAILLYRNFKLPAALLAGAVTGVSAAIYDFIVWNAGTDVWSYRIPYAAITVVSGAVVAGVGSWALVRALAPTGVLDRFGAGRERASV
ncbi:ABC transporter permease [Actinoplanes italicus]|uniref:Energy-coupling factor transport system substrate-specific component n=1 Tax=Actinoplanes italicus TaxID=113567 RepID=A0A2T0KII3_9ACTN|nr:ECF transporter S component [Actinoplanes italicus]PRX23335.1 energy-coupling factor transport system substrate-specific component [Actinoplanes italicus]GIE29836.1 ABC transporter permease [Actinoplanes italicus]